MGQMGRRIEGRPIRVLIVDDSAVVRETMASLINAEPGMEVMGTASDPFVAAQRIRDERPDVITLDIEMPRMDGLTFLRRLMVQHPIPVLMCSSLVGANSATLAQAMAAGAVDVICKPDVGVKEFLEESRVVLCDAIRAAAQAKLGALRPSLAVEGKLTADAILPPPSTRTRARVGECIVALGVSTGGTEAIRVLLQHMPADCPPTVVVQHMPEGFTATFAKRLNEICPMEVREAQQSDKLRRGLVLIAPGNRHLLVKRGVQGYVVDLRDGPLVSRHRPSVDVLFRSVAQNAGVNALGVIMTGMGDDGAKGLLEMRRAGSHTLGQDEDSCVVYGMPKEANRLGAVERELSLNQLGRAIVTIADRAKP